MKRNRYNNDTNLGNLAETYNILNEYEESHSDVESKEMPSCNYESVVELIIDGHEDKD